MTPSSTSTAKPSTVMVSPALYVWVGPGSRMRETRTSMERTVFGRYIYAVAGNQKAAELSGIRVHFYRIAALVLVAVFASIAGLLLASRLGSAQCR